LNSTAPKNTHTVAALTALGITALPLAIAVTLANTLEHRFVHRLAPVIFPQKNQGIALQKIAFDHADLLPFYGSSELLKPAPNKAPDFFRTYPTGFSIFSVGKAGAASLITSQRLAAVGSDLNGKKVAISVSPTWFFHESPAAYYNGNFSLHQAGEMIYGRDLSFDLKRDVARRMLEYPLSLEKSALLAFTLRQLATDGPLERALYYGTVPLGFLQNAILRIQDHIEMLFYMIKNSRHLNAPAKRDSSGINWSLLIAAANSQVRGHGDTDPEPIGAERGSQAFAAGVQDAHEWIDFELLLRVLTELRAKPLLLSIPIDGRYFERFGVGRPFRDLYYKRVESLARAYHVPIVDFADHDLDQDFLSGHHDHLTDKGWLYFDKTLDDFAHNRPL
jgi:D-alanine transfer protein